MESLARTQPQPDGPHDVPPPRNLPWGEKELLVRRGPRVPRGSLGQCPVLSTRPSRWLGRRPMGPSPAPQPDTGESGMASSLFQEEAESQSGRLPRLGCCLRQLAKLEPA